MPVTPISIKHAGGYFAGTLVKQDDRDYLTGIDERGYGFFARRSVFREGDPKKGVETGKEKK